MLPKLQLMKKLRELRVKSGYTQQQVSEILNCARSTYTYYEIGKSSPDLPTLVKLAKIFNVSVSELLEEEKTLLSEAEGFTSKFETAMEDDFNTADALAAIFELVKFANTNVTEKSSAAFAEALLSQLVKLSDVLGLKVIKKEEILDKEIEALIEERQEARKAKNFARADEIRDELLEKGIILKDTREGVKWKRA